MLRADEQLITSHGLRTFAELEDTSCRVLTDDGFKPAVVKRFRQRPFLKIEFAPAFEERDRYGGTRLTTRNISRFRRTVSATPTHGWVLADGQKTNALASGSSCRRRVRAEARRRDVSPWRPARSGLRRRIVEQGRDSVGRAPSLRAAVRRSCRSIPRLLRSARTSHRRLRRPSWLRRYRVVRSCANLKQLLPETADAEYIAGFVDGWLAADGDPVRAGSWRTSFNPPRSARLARASGATRRLHRHRFGPGRRTWTRTSAFAPDPSAGSTSRRESRTGVL